MKKIIILLFAGLLIVSCASKQPAPVKIYHSTEEIAQDRRLDQSSQQKAKKSDVDPTDAVLFLLQSVYWWNFATW